MAHTLKDLDTYYAGQLGCNPGDLNSRTLLAVATDAVASIRFAMSIPLAVFSMNKGAGGVIAVRTGLKDALDSALAPHSDLDHDACEAVRAAVDPLIRASDWFYGQRLYCEPDHYTDCACGEVRMVTTEDETAVELSHKWGGEVFGQMVDGRVVSWAAVKPLSDVVWDISVRTLRDYRGRGYAKSVVSAAVRFIFDHDRLAAWGTHRTNLASLNTARAVGFRDYALEFGCVEETD